MFDFTSEMDGGHMNWDAGHIATGVLTQDVATAVHVAGPVH